MDFEMDFGTALDMLKAGEIVARKAWYSGMKLRLYQSSDDDAEGRPFLYAEHSREKLFPYIPRTYWEPRQEDILADDWGIIK